MILIYIQDDIKINSLSKNFLLSVLMSGNQIKYFSLFNQYKEIITEKKREASTKVYSCYFN